MKTTKKMENKITCAIENKNGMTLVEMIVTFAILAIFMVAATQLIASGLSIYNHVKGTSYGKQVADTVLEKVAGEIEGAQTASAVFDRENAGSSAATFIIQKDMSSASGEKKDVITLYDRTGSKINISCKDFKKSADKDISEIVNTQYMMIYYYPVYSMENNTQIRYEEVNWTFDQAMYMGYHIKSLTFTQACKEDASYAPNIIRIDLTIDSEKYGEYSQTRYVACYNFKTEADYNKIEVLSE